MREERVHAALGWALFCSMLLGGVALARGEVAPYGRYAQVRSLGLGWGPPIDARLAWALQELPALLVPLLLWASTDYPAAGSPANRALLLLFCSHYFNRSIVYPLSIHGGKGRYLTKLYTYPSGWLTSPYFFAGFAIMIAGAAMNVHSDFILRRLRSQGTIYTGEKGYKIPRGGMFEFVSGANFFGEIVEWVGFAVASGFSQPAVIFAFCTAFNIGPRALQHHNWYVRNFGREYTALNRRALVPFVL